MSRDEETGLFSAPSESTVQQLWMDVQQFEEASNEWMLTNKHYILVHM